MTKIFATYEEFEAREDKSLNGVSPKFAKENPNWKAENTTNRGCWNCIGCGNCWNCVDCVNCWVCLACSNCSNCSNCRDCRDCRDCRNCYTCEDCRGCTDCVYCVDCRDCTYCRNCRSCTSCAGCKKCTTCVGCKKCTACDECTECTNCEYCTKCKDCRVCYDKHTEEGVNPGIPVIENIHQKVYEAASRPGALDMEEWHTCETTHCRAGWVVHLAGEAGYKLEEACDTSMAALLIYGASSPIPVTLSNFTETNEEALESMREAAEEEKRLNKEKP